MCHTQPTMQPGSLTSVFLLCGLLLQAAQVHAGDYPPAAGQPGSTAVPADDPRLIAWISSVTDYAPGPEADEMWRDTNLALGPADGDSFNIVSLGRGGQITVTFTQPIRNGVGNDFAVFENSFSDTFLELAFVEVSSDGINFFRFPSRSETTRPVPQYGTLDPTDVNGLAGKYRRRYGTPFDLDNLSTDPQLDTNAVTHIRLIDIVGDGSARDSLNQPIYDPYPTVGSAGFDLDGIGIFQYVPSGGGNTFEAADFQLIPADGGHRVSAFMEFGYAYTIEISGKLDDPHPIWMELSQILVGNNSVREFDPLVTAIGAQYFRLRRRSLQR